MPQLVFRVDAERHTFYLCDKTGQLSVVIKRNNSISVTLKPEAELVMMVMMMMMVVMVIVATNQSIHTTSSS